MTEKLPWMCSIDDCERKRTGSLDICETHRAAQAKEKMEESKPEKKFKPIKRTAISKNPATWKNTTGCTDGSRVAEEVIQRKLKKIIAFMDATRTMQGGSIYDCDATGTREMVIDHDHTIAKARCKELGKTELIWDPANIEYSSRKAHKEWESYKNGEFRKHRNFERRMEFMKEHDHEGYTKRMEIVELFNKPTQTI